MRVVGNEEAFQTASQLTFDIKVDNETLQTILTVTDGRVKTIIRINREGVAALISGLAGAMVHIDRFFPLSPMSGSAVKEIRFDDTEAANLEGSPKE